MVTFATSTPTNLLTRIKQLIDNGTIKTWSYDSDGDFTHTATQWNGKGWLRPSATSSGLQLSFLAPTSGGSREVYGVYQGRFQEMMIVHFFKSFTVASCTPEPVGGDSSITAA